MTTNKSQTHAPSQKQTPRQKRRGFLVTGGRQRTGNQSCTGGCEGCHAAFSIKVRTPQAALNAGDRGHGTQISNVLVCLRVRWIKRTTCVRQHLAKSHLVLVRLLGQKNADFTRACLSDAFMDQTRGVCVCLPKRGDVSPSLVRLLAQTMKRRACPSTLQCMDIITSSHTCAFSFSKAVQQNSGSPVAFSVVGKRVCVPCFLMDLRSGWSCVDARSHWLLSG